MSTSGESGGRAAGRDTLAARIDGAAAGVQRVVQLAAALVVDATAERLDAVLDGLQAVAEEFERLAVVTRGLAVDAERALRPVGLVHDAAADGEWCRLGPRDTVSLRPGEVTCRICAEGIRTRWRARVERPAKA